MNANEKPEWVPDGYEQALGRITRLGPKPKVKWHRPNRALEWLAKWCGFESPFEKRIGKLIQDKALAAEKHGRVITLRFDYIHVWHTVRIGGEVFAAVGYSQHVSGHAFRPHYESGTVLHASEIGQINGGN